MRLVYHAARAASGLPRWRRIGARAGERARMDAASGLLRWRRIGARAGERTYMDAASDGVTRAGMITGPGVACASPAA
jgi:hypothetical protein